MHYVYVLESKRDRKLYVGYTKNINLRFEQHNKKRVKSTKKRTPLKLIYLEICINQKDATKREKYLKTTYGSRYIKNRLKSYFTG